MKTQKVSQGKYNIINNEGIKIGSFNNFRGKNFWCGKVFTPEQQKQSGYSSGKEAGIVENTMKDFIEAFKEKFNEKGERLL